MSMRVALLAVVAGLALSSPVVAKEPRAPDVPFSTADVAWAKGPGPGAISGEAMLRTRGGDVKTCAGFEVRLFPSSPYFDSYVRQKRGERDKLFPKAVALDGEAERYIRSTTCNSAGKFDFKRLPKGEYWVVAIVTWDAPTRYGLAAQGGELFRQVEVLGGAEAEEVMISQ